MTRISLRYGRTPRALARPIAPVLSRRQLVLCLPAVVLAGSSGWSRSTSARQPTAALDVTVQNHAVGALVQAVGRELVTVRVDRALAPRQVVLAGSPPLDIASRVRFKGSGPAQGRFLDDARNATTAAANIRDALIAAMPGRATTLRNNHQGWSRPFARQALRWTQTLSRSPIRNRRLADTYSRIYLLEWAGVIIDTKATATPTALAKLPSEPTTSTAEAYTAYVTALVSAVMSTK